MAPASRKWNTRLFSTRQLDPAEWSTARGGCTEHDRQHGCRGGRPQTPPHDGALPHHNSADDQKGETGRCPAYRGNSNRGAGSGGGQPQGRAADPLTNHGYLTAKHSAHAEPLAAMLCLQALLSEELVGARDRTLRIAPATGQPAIVAAQGTHHGFGGVGRGYWLNRPRAHTRSLYFSRRGRGRGGALLHCSSAKPGGSSAAQPRRRLQAPLEVPRSKSPTTRHCLYSGLRSLRYAGRHLKGRPGWWQRGLAGGRLLLSFVFSLQGSARDR
ncbi:hypothetical protein, conserved [Leishmania lindenbergi]|uniref:Uncharacterized protein n=1 Tax=Leishmania lindenbergi TaxID=651832 RepID=A0AAW3A6Z7_9TRYP